MSLTVPIKKFVKVFILIGLFSGLTIANALTISPARIELSGDPGASISGDFLLINEQDAEQTFYTSVENFEAQGESGSPSFSTSKEGFASWVNVIDQVTLKKGERIKIPFTVNVPKDADAGGHFAAIFFSTVRPSLKAGEVAVGAKIGTLMLLKVSGDIKEGGGVLSFALKEGGHFATTLPINFVYRFSNTGNDRVNPIGDISIRNSIGFETMKINANPSVGNILPNSVRRFEVKWGEEEPLSASASFFNHVRYEARNFALGIYFANMNLSFGSSSTSNNSLIFFVLPWHLLIVSIIILGIIFLILRSMLKRYNKYIIAQARLSHNK